jgi:cell division protein FtsL
MIRLPTLFWLIVVSSAGFAMFAVKYQVQGLADQLVRTAKQADAAERDIHVLDAEWAYLNRPDALAQMNQRFLSLMPIATKQLRSNIADIPMRPAPPSSPPAVETVAAAGPIATASAAQNPSPESASPSPQAPPAEHPGPVAPAVRETQIAAFHVRPAAAARAAARPAPTHRAASLTELIAQIAEDR